MKFTHVILFLFTLSFPIFGYSDLHTSDNKSIGLVTSKEASSHKDKNKNTPSASEKKKKGTPANPQQLYESSIQKAEEAQRKESSVPRTLKNINEVSASLNAAAELYQKAISLLEQAQKLVQDPKDIKLLQETIRKFTAKVEACRTEATEWPTKVLTQKNVLKERLAFLKKESSSLKADGQERHYWNVQKQIAGILQELINIGEGNPTELATLQSQISAFEGKASTIHPSEKKDTLSSEALNEHRKIFYDSLAKEQSAENLSHSGIIPLDGQAFSDLYTDQLYRYLIQKDAPASYLRVKVYDNQTLVHEEKIAIPLQNTLSWEHYIALDQMISIPETTLQSRFGLDLRLTIVSDPYHSFSLLIAQKAAQTNYTFAFSLEESPLYELDFTSPPPSQLEALRKPGVFNAGKPLETVSPTIPLSINDGSGNADPLLRHDPRLDLLVEEMKKDPFALAQYVYNEIEFCDPFMTRKDGVFLAPSIHRSPYGTFLAKEGSPWEQCVLLVYLLRQAGYQAIFTEGTCTLSASVAEKLLFLQLSGEKEVSLNYPGVLFFDERQKEWISLYPWMKEIHVIEGHDLYSFMPAEYANADLWIKQYLCNDKSILKHIGTDGDDTAGVLFTRFIEEKLQEKGLSLEDVGSRKKIHKKQFASWRDFPRPSIKGDLTTTANLPQRTDLFASLQIRLGGVGSSPFSLAYINNQTCPIQFSFTGTSYDVNMLMPNGSSLSMSTKSTDNMNVSVIYYEPVSNTRNEKVFPIAVGTSAALCFQFGKVTPEIVSLFGEQLSEKNTPDQRWQALFSFIGAAYYEKCSRYEKILADLHKVTSTTYIRFGLVKLAPDLSKGTLQGKPDLKFPQVDMNQGLSSLDHHMHPFSLYNENHTAFRQFCALICANNSANEHQILREIYEDPYAISTVKLLQLAHQEHQKKGGSGPGFLIFTNKSFSDAGTQPEMARHLYFSHLKDINLRCIKNLAKGQWKQVENSFKSTLISRGDFAYAYMTPGVVQSQDNKGLRPSSYSGMGTLIISPCMTASLISDGSMTLNGGYGSRLPDWIAESIDKNKWNVITNGESYKIRPAAPLPGMPIPSNPNNSKISDSNWWKLGSPINIPLIQNQKPVNGLNTATWKAEVRPEHKPFLNTVADPVDVITGAFYVDEVDLTLPGPFQLEVRRNYNSQNPLPGLLGCGWKLSLNPVLMEEGKKLYASEKDGTVIVYTFDETSARWIVLPDENPELNNFNQQGIGSTANPFHAYIEKKDGYILHSPDGSTRIFQDYLLTKWTDHSGNFLTFSYKENRLTQIESSNGSFLGFHYNHEGKISEAYAKDGRRVYYRYNFLGDLVAVTLPNGAIISYDYDQDHQIIKESKPHGRVLENRYRDGKVYEQLSPAGLQQKMMVNASFSYGDGVTTVKDAAGGCTEYKINLKKIYKITDPAGNITLQSWFIDDKTYYDAATASRQPWNQPGAHSCSLKSSTDKRGLTTQYLYNAKGNPQEITLVGEDLTGKGDRAVTKHFTYNDRNLCVLEETLNNKTITVYDPVHPYLPKRIEKYSGDTLVSFIDREYTERGHIFKEAHSGAVTLWTYDQRGFPETMTQQAGLDDPDVVTRFNYSDQGQCIDLITDDAIQHHEYDIMGNRYCSTISLPSGKIISKTYVRHDLNNEVIWRQGDDSNDTLHLDYSAAGLLQAASQSLTKANGSAIEPAGVAYTLYEYDACGRLIEEVDPLGNCTYRDYDALGRVFHVTKEGLTTTFTYEAGGLVASVTSQSGAMTTRTYTSNGLPISEVYPDGTKTSYVYDFFGRPIEEVKNDNVQTIRYDDAAHQVIRSQGELTEVETFDFRGNLISRVDPAGHEWVKTYDGLNRLKTETTPSGYTTNWNYRGDTITCTLPSGEQIVERYEAGSLVESQTQDSQGILIASTRYDKHPDQGMIQEIRGDVVTTTWKNTLGLPIRIQQGNLTTTHYYDPVGNCIATVDGDGHLTQRKFDGLGRIERKTLPDGAIIGYKYDVDSNLIAFQMPGNLTWVADYDLMGRKRFEELQANGKISQHWDYLYENGQLKQVKDPLDRTHAYTYDAHSRIIAENVGQYARTYEYDPRGFLTSLKESGNDVSQVERVYDSAGRLIQEEITLNGAIVHRTQQSWTPSTRTLEIGNHKRELCYQVGQLKRLAVKDFELSYDYTMNGLLAKKTSPFSTVDTHYNTYGLPETIHTQLRGDSYEEILQWTNSGKLSTQETTYPNSTRKAYTYSSQGHIKTVNNESYMFDFDQAGRGIRTISPNSEIPSNGLDSFGKILVEAIDNKMIDIAYDDIGQVIANGNDRLSWDPWGRLIAVTNDTYDWSASYDALGRRLKTYYAPLKNDSPHAKQREPLITTSFYDPEDKFQEIGINYDGRTFWKLCKDTSCDAIIDEEGNVVTLVHDIQGNLSAIVSSQDIIWNQHEPSPYGPLSTPSLKPELFSVAQAHIWQSKRVDPTGYIWLGARYYNPYGGRFLSPDPISHPTCLDLYAYANGDPINNIDPDGRFASYAYQGLGSFTIDLFNSHRVQGGLRATAGFGEILSGSALACIPGGITQIGGCIVTAHGLDNFLTGCSQFYYNESRTPATVQLLQKTGMSHNAAHMTNDVGIVLATMGAYAVERAAMRAVAPRFDLPKSEFQNNGNSTTLYRSVKPEELMDIRKTGIYRNLGDAEGKYFTTSIEGASSYAKKAVYGFGDPPYTLTRTSIPNNMLNGMPPTPVDGGIPAMVISDRMLEGLIPEIMTWMAIPK
ncbi:MAG: DUF6531 domain-containing protein [Parachlamydiaceae bacterium]